MNKFIFSLITLCLVSCISKNPTSPAESLRQPAQYGGEIETKIPMLDFNTTVELFKKNNVTNIEEGLRLLSLQYPAYMKMHTLMYASFSLHGSSFEEPRAIVFGPKADFVFTFNGGTHQRGGTAFEVMQYDANAGKFEFREIEFKVNGQTSPNTLKEADIVFENDHFKVSKANPQKCTLCHGANPRPIFDTYFLWPGAYGSNDDNLTTLFDKLEVERNPNYNLMLKAGVKAPSSQGRLIQLKPGTKDVEVEGFKSYVARKPAHPRYKYLPDRAHDVAFMRLNKGERPENIDITKEMDFGGQRYSHNRPNLVLNGLLHRQTMESLVTRAERNEVSRKVPYMLLSIQSPMLPTATSTRANVPNWRSLYGRKGRRTGKYEGDSDGRRDRES